MDDVLPWTAHVLLERLSETIGFPIGIAIQFPEMIIFILITLALIYYFFRQFRAANREIKRLNSVNDGKLLNSIGESCKGLQIIRAFEK